MARIMIADDAEFMRLVLRKMLEKGGHEVVGEADNGRDAVYLYTMLHPDLVTLDITMPFLSGLDAAQRIKENHPDARILMVSAMGTRESVERANSIGVKGFIVKPFQEEQVLSAIDKALEG
ncbi:response regulator [Thermanaerovibrio acidaminovorans]|uniref:response regulator n=1 Tax=Thermanaerovibrio acidaminovorans TaxID=81462 RepID=UPI002492357B|nr:response regulator [Thermanaerovibrio acidaminovorans]